MKLAEAVLTYYFTHASELSSAKRFHLANRVAAWNKDARAVELLASCKDWLVPQPLTEETLEGALSHTAEVAVRGASHIAAYELRQPYFERYPDLLPVEAELFHVRHLNALFGIDARSVFLRRHPLASLQELERSLLANPSALRACSSWAVNFLYLLYRQVMQDAQGIDAEALYALGDGYDTTDNEQLRLLLYLYTHCIIAESDFYTRELPAHTLPVYQKMLSRLETLLAAQLDSTSLDTKLEFLVSCRLAGYQTTLGRAIHDECAASLSPSGTFLVDTHNTFAKNDLKKTFEASEHRNVLFTMSVLPRLNNQTT